MIWTFLVAVAALIIASSAAQWQNRSDHWKATSMAFAIIGGAARGPATMRAAASDIERTRCAAQAAAARGARRGRLVAFDARSSPITTSGGERSRLQQSGWTTSPGHSCGGQGQTRSATVVARRVEGIGQAAAQIVLART
jgi:hypothetical protein